MACPPDMADRMDGNSDGASSLPHHCAGHRGHMFHVITMGPCPSHGPDYGTRHGRAHWSCTLQSMLAHHAIELGAHIIGPNSWLPSVYHCAALDRAPPVRNSSTMLARAHQAAEKPGILMMS